MLEWKITSYNNYNYNITIYRVFENQYSNTKEHIAIIKGKDFLTPLVLIALIVLVVEN